jgi:hypothetical protein
MERDCAADFWSTNNFAENCLKFMKSDGISWLSTILQQGQESLYLPSAQVVWYLSRHAGASLRDPPVYFRGGTHY